MESVWPSLVAKQHKTLVLVWRTLYMHPTSLFTRLSPWTTKKKSEEESLVPFCTWCTAHQRHSFNDLFCYVTTTELQLLWQQKIDREIILMAMTAKEVTWWYRQPGILVQFTISIECNLLIPDSPVTKICAPKLTSAIYCLAWTFFPLQQAKTCNSQKYRVTEQAVCMWVYLYIRDICSVASQVKGTRLSPSFLPLLPCGGEPGNEASTLPLEVQHRIKVFTLFLQPSQIRRTIDHCHNSIGYRGKIGGW